MSACVDEFDKGNKEGDGKSIRLTLRVPDNAIINPMTKAAQEMSQKVENITVLAYNKRYDLIASKTYNIGADDALNTGGTYTTEAIPVGEGASGYVFAVANAGDLSGISYDDLKKKSFGLNGTSPLPIMCASGDVFPDDPKTSDPSYSFKGIEFDATSNSNISIELVRIYARITVVVKRGDDLSQELTITPQTLKVYNVPQTGTLVGPNLIESSEGSLRDGEMLKSVDKDNDKGNWDYTGNAEKTTDVLYLYENMQPDGYCGKDQTSKTPKSFGEAITNTTQLMTDAKSSFIEVYAKYERKNNPTTGWIKYRFFLGKDATTNFSVQRNVNYKVTLTLHKNGGVDESTWRVETEKIPGKINVSDVYISYLGGSTVEMLVTGDVEGIGNGGMPELGTIDDPGNTGGTIIVDNLIKDENGLHLKFTATTTNVHDYREKVMPVTFKMNNGDEYKVNVRQVPRLVDPIAIYKRADNERATEIVVKEFNISTTPGRYDTLQSKGRWTAEIDPACTDWVRISTTDANYGTKLIEGDGPVHFWYKPKDQNVSDGDGKGEGNEGEVDKGRYGKITVRYHGVSCVHEIFLRQGYQPMTIKGDPGYAWSAYNCLGKASNEDKVPGKTTVSPTQTGWLFNGGVNIAMHPFLPEYQVGFRVFIDKGLNIKYSDGLEHQYGYVDNGKNIYDNQNNSNWQQKMGSSGYNVDNYTESAQGPCPDGYMVADAWRYNALTNKNNMMLYTGYVHDDDVVRGWNYEKLGDGIDAVVEDNNHCNPAKGGLFVEKNGIKNLFFSYGKGVLKDIRTLSKDNFLLDEIGVGRRYTNSGTGLNKWFGYLSVSDNLREYSYGGWYWNATPFATSNMGKVDFGYNIFSPNPVLIDVPDGRLDGINVYDNADFVRCVKIAIEKIDLQILAKFESAHSYGDPLKAMFIKPKGFTDIWNVSVDDGGKCSLIKKIPKTTEYEICWSYYGFETTYRTYSYEDLMNSSKTFKISWQ